MGEGLRLAEERGELPDLALTHFRYAEILHSRGHLKQSRENLDQAFEFFLDMEMTWWLEQAEELRERLPPPS